MSDGEQIGQCRREITAAYESTRYKPSDSDMLLADAIDRLAADVAAIKARIDAISPEDVAHLVECEKAWVGLVEEKETAAIRERDQWREEARLAVINRDEARAEAERLRAELAAPQPAAKIDDSLDGLEMMVHAWAHTRKILSDSSPQAQLVKLTEEVGELAAGVCRNDRQRIIDAIGDTTVVLIVMCGILRLSFRRCLQAAYDEIRGRSGTIEGGVFVKAHAAPPPAGNSPETPDSSLAAPQPAAPEPAYYLVTNERDMPIHVSRMHPGVGWDGCTITALYAAPQPAGHGISPGLPETQSAGNAAPPAGWLTEEERRVLGLIAMERRTDSDLHWFNDVLPAIRSILSRAGSPPVVEVPVMVFGGGSYQMEKRYRAAMDRAGVAWKEVPRE